MLSMSVCIVLLRQLFPLLHCILYIAYQVSYRHYHYHYGCYRCCCCGLSSLRVGMGLIRMLLQGTGESVPSIVSTSAIFLPLFVCRIHHYTMLRMLWTAYYFVCVSISLSGRKVFNISVHAVRVNQWSNRRKVQHTAVFLHFLYKQLQPTAASAPASTERRGLASKIDTGINIQKEEGQPYQVYVELTC